MGINLLNSLYEKIYGEEFNPTTFNSRMEMQKAIYLIQEAGFAVGEYDFLWYKHGPHSQNLQNDILRLSNVNKENVIFTEEATAVLNDLNSMLNQENSYGRSKWVECIASILYLKKYVYPNTISDEELISKLVEKKPHLDKPDINMMALHEVKNMYFA